MGRYIFLFQFLLYTSVQGQILESFDKEFNIPGYWEGNIDLFQINDKEQLQLNDDQANSSSLFFKGIPANRSSLEWEIKVKQSFSGSANNNSRIYLLTDEPISGDSTNGYYLQLGESGSTDAIELFKQSGNQLTSLIRGIDGEISSSFEIRLKIILDSLNAWTLYVDNNAARDFQLIGSIIDENIISGEYFGIQCKYTSSNSTKLYFDDIYIGRLLHDKDPFLDSLVALSKEAFENDIVINEILFNPYPFGSDFIEIYNRSKKHINLKNWSLANLDNYDKSVSNLKSISEDDFVISPKQYIVLTKDTSNIVFEYPESTGYQFLQIESLPTYSNETGTVILLNDSSIIIDSTTYHEDQQFVLLENTDGISLERIHFDRLSSDKTNWHSSAEQNNFATPGYQNSQFNQNHSMIEVNLDPVLFTPNNDGFDDVVTINYQFKQEGYVGNIHIFDSQGRRVTQLINNELLGVAGSYTWDGTDDNESVAIEGIYIIYFEAFHISGDLQKSKGVCVIRR
ncbi:MAG: lamin tail domain-containing protein [Flavobacteriales bacterium]|nr:lamin tail domain-containing protein [Flavobacteriales bacterium]